MVENAARILCTCAALAAIAAAAGPGARAEEELAVEPHPSVFEEVRDRTMGFPEPEHEAYYKVLDHARRVDDRMQQSIARQNRLERIRETAAPESRERLLENAEEFPVFVDLFKNPEDYRGKLVTLRGHVRRLVSYPAGENEFGIETLYEAWIYTDDSQGNPAVIVCTEVPEKMPRGDDLNEQASATGYFFKMYGYRARDATRIAPMVLAQRLVWYPPAEPLTWRPSPRAYVLLGTSVLGVVLLVWWLSQSDRQAARRRRVAAAEDAPPNFREPDPDQR